MESRHDGDGISNEAPESSTSIKSGLSDPSATPAPVTQGKKACIFFQRGRCNRGAACSFAHDGVPEGGATAAVAQSSPLAPPPPLIINIPPGAATIFSIDVECVATGKKIVPRESVHVNKWYI